MSTSGRTFWWPKDAGWWRRERVVELGERFGAAGPMVLDWLTCEAKAQNDKGRVKSGVGAVARGCFVERVQVRPVLSAMSEIGAVDDLEWIDDRFTCRISGWKADIELPLDAHRKRQARADAPETLGFTPPNVRERPRMSEVSEMSEKSTTGQNRTDIETPLTPQGGNQDEVPILPPERPKGDRGRDHKTYQAEFDAWVEHWFPGCSPKGVAMLVSQLRGGKREPTPDAVRELAETSDLWRAALDPVAV